MMQQIADFIGGDGGELVLFAGFSLLTLLSALLVVSAKRVTHACVSLLPCFIGIAALYAMLASPVMLAFQLLIYAGGIMVLMLFAIFLLERRTGPIIAAHHQVAPALLVAGITAVTILGAVRQETFKHRGFAKPRDELVLTGELSELDGTEDWFGYYEIDRDDQGKPTEIKREQQRPSNVRRTGFYFLTYYLLPFELTSLILVIAMVGAIIMARRERGWVAAGRSLAENEPEDEGEEAVEETAESEEGGA